MRRGRLESFGILQFLSEFTLKRLETTVQRFAEQPLWIPNVALAGKFYLNTLAWNIFGDLIIFSGTRLKRTSKEEDQYFLDR